MTIIPAIARRKWMDRTPSGFANRCLPLLIANQWGWFILNPYRFEVLWNGGPHPNDLHIRLSPNSGAASHRSMEPLVRSHFGHGIITWRIPYLIRTPPGWNLYVRGPANWCKDGVAPLDAVVETDWSPAPFTMNARVTRPDAWISFEQNEPVCMVFPVPRQGIECFSPEIRSLSDEPDLQREFAEWKRSREDFNAKLTADPSGTAWQKHYFRGTSVLGHPFPGHRTRVNVKPFRDLRGC